jgi:hypothetical protein
MILCISSLQIGEKNYQTIPSDYDQLLAVQLEGLFEETFESFTRGSSEIQYVEILWNIWVGVFTIQVSQIYSLGFLISGINSQLIEA